jgi:hypothetical protein
LHIANLFHIRSYIHTIYNYTSTAMCSIPNTSPYVVLPCTRYSSTRSCWTSLDSAIARLELTPANETFCLTAAHTLSYKPLVGQWTTCLVSLLRCHLVYRLHSSSRYMARLLSDVVFTGVVRQRCQSCLLLLSNQRASARLGSLRLTSALLGTARRNTA